MDYQVSSQAAQLIADFKESIAIIKPKRPAKQLINQLTPQSSSPTAVATTMDAIGILSIDDLKKIGIRTYTRDRTIKHPDGTIETIKETMVF